MGMRLLLLLARRAPHTVSRDEMIDALWQGRVVTDDAVNKQVSKVRSALTDRSGQSLLETVPKLGVRLTETPRQPGPVKQRQLWQVTLAAVLAVSAFLYLGNRPAAIEVTEEPLTSAPGAEFDPALSADARMVAFVEKSRPDGHARLFIRPLDGDRLRQISRDDVDAAAPSWAPDGKLAFVLRQKGGCRIIVRLASGALAADLPCIGAEVGGLAWLGPRFLVVSDRPGLGQSYRLSIVDLETMQQRQLTRPPAGDVGDIRPVASRDGSAVYFLRNPTVGSGGLYKVKVGDGRVDRLAADATAITGMGLGPGDSLILSAQRGSDSPALWRFDPPGSWQRLGPSPASRIVGSADGHTFVFSRVEKQTVLWQLPLKGGGGGSALFPSTRSDWSPVAAPNGKLVAFLSNRSGSEEVWVLDRSNGRAKRVSDFGGPLLQDLAWSANSQRLLTSVPTNGQFDIVELDLASGKAKPIAASPLDERHGAFASDGKAVDFVRRSGKAFTLCRFDPSSGTTVKLADSVMRLVPGGGDRLVFTRPFEAGTWTADLNGRNARLLAPFPSITRPRDITIVGKTAYSVKIDGRGAKLASINLDSGEIRDIRQLPDIARPSGIAIVGGAVIYARLLREEADLYRLRLKD